MKKLFFTFLLVAIAGTFLISFTGRGGYKVGDNASDFKLKNVDGKMVSLSDFKDANGFIVVFTCNNCPYAKMYEDRLIGLQKKYSAKGYKVIAINPNSSTSSGENLEAMAKRAKDKDFNFPYLADENQEVSSNYGPTHTPHVYVIKKDGEKLEVTYTGAIDDNYKNPQEAQKRYVEDAVEAAISGKRPSVESTKSIGCTIKWKQA